MQRIRNSEEVISKLKPLLKDYLGHQNVAFHGAKFTCPNHSFHNNNDATPSAGFVPGTDEQIFHCFACGISGDIFTAFKHLENREIAGSYWFEVVKELAERYGITCEFEPLKKEEIEFNNLQTFLQTLTKNANSYLNKNHPKKAYEYIKNRNWVSVIDYFQLGFLPDTPNVRKFINDSFIKYPELHKYLGVEPGQSDDFASFLVERLIYPIKHRYTYVLGIVTRSLIDDDPRPKYVKHFIKFGDKRGVVYNLSKAYKSVYLVEGASSVFTLHANGIQNVVSILGADSFNENVYSTLVNSGIDRVVLCLDADKAGVLATNKILELSQTKSDIKFLVKAIPYEGKDPDDFVKEYGIEEFKKIPEVSGFKFQLTRFISTPEEEQLPLKNSLLEMIINTKEPTTREKMFKMLVNETGMLKTTWAEEIARYEKTKGITSDVGVGEVLREETALLKDIEGFEEKALRCERLKGIPFGFPKLETMLDGLQTGLYFIAGKWNLGKSAFQSSIILNLIKEPTNYVLHFAIDDPKQATTIPRYIANLSRLDINEVSNPIWRIDKNETLLPELKEELKRRRNDAIELLKGYSSRLGIKDSTDGYDSNFIEKTIKTYRVIAGNRKLIVFVDFLNLVKLSGFKGHDQTQLEAELANFFKRMSALYDCPVICTVEGNKTIESATSDEKDIKGSASMQYRADLVFMLSSDFGLPKSWMYFYNEEERDPDPKEKANPIIKVWVSKNKLSGFKQSVYFNFYRKQSRYVECSEQEQREYSRKN